MGEGVTERVPLVLTGGSMYGKVVKGVKGWRAGRTLKQGLANACHGGRTTHKRTEAVAARRPRNTQAPSQVPPRKCRPDSGEQLCADTAARRRPGGFVVTVVRGTGDDAARSRLRSGYDTGDAGLLETFDRLAEGRLKVFAGAPRASARTPQTSVRACTKSACALPMLLVYSESLLKNYTCARGSLVPAASR